MNHKARPKFCAVRIRGVVKAGLGSKRCSPARPVNQKCVTRATGEVSGDDSAWMNVSNLCSQPEFQSSKALGMNSTPVHRDTSCSSLRQFFTQLLRLFSSMPALACPIQAAVRFLKP